MNFQTATNVKPLPALGVPFTGQDESHEALIRTLAVAAPVAMVLVDAACEVRLTTDAARAMLLPITLLREATLADFADPTLEPAVREVLAKGEPTQLTVLIEPGHKRFDRRIEPCRSADGSVVGACATYRENERAQVAHDLRSPLTAIAMWAKFIRSRPLGEAERAQGLDTILRSVDAQQRLLDRFAEG